MVELAKNFVDFCSDFLLLGLSLCAVGGLLLALWSAVSRRSSWLLVVACSALALGVLAVVGGAVPRFVAPAVHRWEGRHPVFERPMHCVSLDAAGERRVVVLGSATDDEPARPALSQLSRPSLARLAEGVAIFRSCGAAAMWFTGDASARVSMLAAVALGVPATVVHIMPGGETTATEAAVLRPVLGDEPFVLVSSALHMPRAMALFEARGMVPVAAPTDFLGSATRPHRALLPNARSYELWMKYLHERIGLLWARLNGELDSAPQ